MLFTCRSWPSAEPCQKKPAPFYIPQRQKTNSEILVFRMQGLSRNKRIQEVEKETARQTVEGAVKLPHFEAPQNDNERLLNYQYDFLVNGSQEAWRNLWELTSATAGRMLAHGCKQRNIHFSKEQWEDKRAEAVMYLLRRYRTRPGYRIEADFPLHIWYAVKHVLDYKRKCDGLVDFVSEKELTAIIESQNEDL